MVIGFLKDITSCDGYSRNHNVFCAQKEISYTSRKLWLCFNIRILLNSLISDCMVSRSIRKLAAFFKIALRDGRK